ncbi:MAG: thiamine phosphate synthase [Longimicrobiales bacterium]
MRETDRKREPVDLREALRVIVITDAGLARPRSVEEVVEAALRGGARAIQLRDKGASARDLLAQARILRTLTRAWNALLFLNDRFDVALASRADGVHLGPDDLPVDAVRRVAPPGFLIGHSTDLPSVARRCAAEGADYIGCGAVFPTTSKADAGVEIGVEGLARVAEAVEIPVVGIGGITPEGARAIAQGSAAAGVAVIGAVMAAPDPWEVVRALLGPFQGRPL